MINWGFDPCHKIDFNARDTIFAGLGSVVGDGIGEVSAPTVGDGWGSALGDTFGGGTSMPNATVDRARQGDQ